MQSPQPSQNPAPGQPLNIQMIVSAIVNAPELRAAARALLNVTQYIADYLAVACGCLSGNTGKALWIGSHMSCFLGFFLYVLTQASWCYMLSVLGAVFTFAVSVCQQFEVLACEASQNKEKIPIAQLVNLESTMLLGAALLHLTTPQNGLKLVSFAVFSWIHLASYVLNDVLPINSFTSSLFPVFGCIEPVLLSVACYVDYFVVAVYYFQVIWRQVSLVYALIFTYLSVRRMEHSELSRISLYNLVRFFHKLSQKPNVPAPINRFADAVKLFVEAMIPIGATGNGYHGPPGNEAASSKTRATSIFFDRVSIIDDLE